MGLDVLGDVSTQPGFKHWELDDNLYRLKDDLALLDPTTVALESLHEAAFRNTGLGNSLFIPKHLIGSLTPEKVCGSFRENFETFYPYIVLVLLLYVPSLSILLKVMLRTHGTVSVRVCLSSPLGESSAKENFRLF